MEQTALNSAFSPSSSAVTTPGVDSGTLQGRKRRPRRRLQDHKYEQTEGKWINCSVWGIDENMAYASFLEKFGGLFQLDRQKLKALKVNVQMSRAVRTRSAAQCRSHHQKMIKVHGSVQRIISHIQTIKSQLDSECCQEQNKSIRKKKSAEDSGPERVSPYLLFGEVNIEEIFAQIDIIDLFGEPTIPNRDIQVINYDQDQNRSP